MPISPQLYKTLKLNWYCQTNISVVGKLNLDQMDNGLK